MKKLRYQLFTLFGALAFMVIVANAGLVIAQQRSGNDTSPVNSNSNSDQGQASENGNESDNAQGRLQGDNLTKCQNKEGNINQSMKRINTRTQLQLNLFGTIAERVQNYYQANNLTLNNYGELTTAIETTRTQAQNTLRTMVQNGGEFACNSEDPHAYANQFRNSFNGTVDGLKAYKTAVRNLIVAVRSVATEEASNE